MTVMGRLFPPAIFYGRPLCSAIVNSVVIPACDAWSKRQVQAEDRSPEVHLEVGIVIAESVLVGEPAVAAAQSQVLAQLVLEQQVDFVDAGKFAAEAGGPGQAEVE